MKALEGPSWVEIGLLDVPFLSGVEDSSNQIRRDVEIYHDDYEVQ